MDRPADGALIRRMLVAARADPAVYADVAADRSANLQAAIVLAVATLSQVVGDIIDSTVAESLGGIVSYAAGWVAIVVIVYLLARALRGVHGTVDPAGLARAMAFSQVPLTLFVVANPALNPALGLVFTVWLTATIAAAVRGVVGVSWLVAVPVALTSLFLVAVAALALG